MFSSCSSNMVIKNNHIKVLFTCKTGRMIIIFPFSKIRNVYNFLYASKQLLHSFIIILDAVNLKCDIG